MKGKTTLRTDKAWFLQSGTAQRCSPQMNEHVINEVDALPGVPIGFLAVNAVFLIEF